MRFIFSLMISAGLVFAATGLTGCNSNSQTDTTDTSEAGHDHDDDHDHDGDGHSDQDADAHADAGGDHSGWWCAEHGVPEGECALCDTSLVATFKEKGDWCDEHNRPESQCFTCNPDNFATFAARYEAKFGEQPPQPTE
ncbi:MAG: RND transporter [Pirellulales bacterium]|nr:RND transporter [Pirellulales bacterium]